jgi:hypothetical protein
LGALHPGGETVAVGERNHDRLPAGRHAANIAP